MELTLAIIISIIGVIITILNFALGRKDKGEKTTSENAYKQGILENKIDNLSKQVDKILLILDGYDKEIDEKIHKAIEHHIAEMHKHIES